MDRDVVSAHKTTDKTNREVAKWNIINITAAYGNDVTAGATTWGYRTGHNGAELRMRSGFDN